MIPDNCRKVRRALARRLSEEPPGFSTSPEWLSSHIAECPSCEQELREIGEVDRALWRSLAAVRERIAPPSEAAVRETVRRAFEPPPEVACLRRIRRTVRTLLWVTFFAFVLLAACALAAGLYRAITGRP